MKIFAKVYALAFLVTLSYSLIAVKAQTPTATCTNMPNDFLELADMRGQLKIDIASLEEDIKNLPSKIEEAKAAESDLRDADEQLKKLQDKAVKSAADEQQIEFLTKIKASNQKLLAGKSSATYQSDLDQKKAEFKEKTQLLRCTEKLISGFFSPEESFKTWMSFAFAFLILLVIVGFFLLSYKDARIRQAIFSGQAGMQFLTLFSLVIAIILFGITGILQDKELAALLGGLSGYILGRNTSPASRSSSLRVSTKHDKETEDGEDSSETSNSADDNDDDSDGQSIEAESENKEQ